MEQALRDIVARIAETQPTFSDAVHLRDDLRMDSVRIMDLVFEIEQAFSVKFPEDRYSEVATFHDLVSVVRSLQL